MRSDDEVLTTLARIYTAREIALDQNEELWAVQRDQTRDHRITDAVLAELVERGMVEVEDRPGGEVALNLTQRGFYYGGREVEREFRAEKRRVRA